MCDAAIFIVMEALVGSFSFVPMDFQMKIPEYIFVFEEKMNNGRERTKRTRETDTHRERENK
tara:strand:+ start:733 stop:918 length:186 start_codon:yes stop_codon:yes gene_type:complete